jgi:hypothetical protein
MGGKPTEGLHLNYGIFNRRNVEISTNQKKEKKVLVTTETDCSN